MKGELQGRGKVGKKGQWRVRQGKRGVGKARERKGKEAWQRKTREGKEWSKAWVEHGMGKERKVKLRQGSDKGRQ